MKVIKDYNHFGSEKDNSGKCPLYTDTKHDQQRAVTAAALKAEKRWGFLSLLFHLL